MAETHFDLSNADSTVPNSVESGQTRRPTWIHDIFVTCSATRDRGYTLTINMELNNPFKVIDARFQQHNSSNSSRPETGHLRIRLPQSTFLVQLNQRISYDECLDVKYAQLAPNIAYRVECIHCDEQQQSHLDKSFGKRMIQLDAELDSMLSEKLLLGLQVLLDQERLELDLYLH